MKVSEVYKSNHLNEGFTEILQTIANNPEISASVGAGAAIGTWIYAIRRWFGVTRKDASLSGILSGTAIGGAVAYIVKNYIENDSKLAWALTGSYSAVFALAVASATLVKDLGKTLRGVPNWNDKINAILTRMEYTSFISNYNDDDKRATFNVGGYPVTVEYNNFGVRFQGRFGHGEIYNPARLHDEELIVEVCKAIFICTQDKNFEVKQPPSNHYANQNEHSPVF